MCPHDDKVRQAINTAMNYSGFCYLCQMEVPQPRRASRKYDKDAADERRRNRQKRAVGTAGFGKLKLDKQH